YSGRGADRDLVSSVTRAYDTIREAFVGLPGLQMGEVEELMEATHTVLDEVWKADGGGGARGSYPQGRMAHLLDVIGVAFCRHVQEHLSGLDIWTGSFTNVRTRLLEAVQVCEKWCRVGEDLTGTFWPGYAPHPWEGDPHRDN
ncbi:unnamed protein product, partial [Choristocarpus tenellus]